VGIFFVFCFFFFGGSNVFQSCSQQVLKGLLQLFPIHSQ
jgi:hypothetical protein